MEEIFAGAVPSELRDPITGHLLRDPVVSMVTGCVFSRDTLAKAGWIDPSTRQVCGHIWACVVVTSKSCGLGFWSFTNFRCSFIFGYFGGLWCY